MESLQEFLDRKPSYDEVKGMHDKNAISAWSSPHPHGMMVKRGNGPYLEGVVKQDGKEKPVKVIDTHGQILCNSGGYHNPEVEAARQHVRDNVGVDAFSENFLNEIVEWCRATMIETLGPKWGPLFKLHFVTSGTEGNDLIRRIAFAQGMGVAELISLINGYSGSGWAANAACGQNVWKGNSTPSLPNMHSIDADMASLDVLLRTLPPTRFKALMLEAGNRGVGGFGIIPDEFIRAATARVRDYNSQKGEKGGDVFPDEVQTALGRTGRAFWASQKILEGMQPPGAIVCAKGIGCNHRAAAVFVREDLVPRLDGLTYHTFADNLEDLAAAGTVFNMAIRDNWTENARLRGEQLATGLEERVKPVSRIPFEVGGRGLMTSITLETAKKVNAVLRRAPLDGWVCGKGGHDGRILRIAPPINIKEEVINDLVEAIGTTFKSEEVEAA